MKKNIRRLICLMTLLICLLFSACGQAGTPAPESPATNSTTTPPGEDATGENSLPGLDALWFMDGEDNSVDNNYYKLSVTEQQELISLLHTDEWKVAPTDSLPQYGLPEILIATDDTAKANLYVMYEENTRVLIKASAADNSSVIYEMPLQYKDALIDWVAPKEAAWTKARVLAMVKTCNEVDSWKEKVAIELPAADLQELDELLMPDAWQPYKGSEPQNWNIFFTIAAGQSGSGLTAGTLPDGSVLIRAVWSDGMITSYYTAPSALTEPLTGWVKAR